MKIDLEIGTTFRFRELNGSYTCLPFDDQILLDGVMDSKCKHCDLQCDGEHCHTMCCFGDERFDQNDVYFIKEQ